MLLKIIPFTFQGIIIIWSLTIPGWNWFFAVVYNSDEVQTNYRVRKLSIYVQKDIKTKTFFALGLPSIYNTI